MTTTFCVSCKATWKHFSSSLWINTSNSIFQLFHIPNLPILTPPRLPCTPSANYVNSSVNCGTSSTNNDNSSIGCGNTFVDCIDTSTNYANKFNDYANTLNNWVNIFVDSASALDIATSNLCIPKPSFLQLLLKDLLVIYSSKLNTMLTSRSFICSFFSLCYICGFCVT